MFVRIKEENFKTEIPLLENVWEGLKKSHFKLQFNKCF